MTLELYVTQGKKWLLMPKEVEDYKKTLELYVTQIKKWLNMPIEVEDYKKPLEIIRSKRSKSNI